MNVCEALTKTEELLDGGRKWTRFTMRNHLGEMCLVGAARRACGEEVETYNALLDELAHSTGRLTPHATVRARVVTAWNDSQYDFGPVEHLLRKTKERVC